MKLFRTWIPHYLQKIRTAVVDDDRRRELMFRGMNWTLALISFVMSVINLFTGEYTLLISTLGFSLLCVLNVLLTRTRMKTAYLYLLFGIEALGLLAFFLISGIPQGFSALWICLIPSFALLIFGRKNGGLFSVAALLMLVFFFWIPAGRALLLYTYTDTFLLRFPAFYAAVFTLSLLVEYVRSETQQQLAVAEKKAQYLSRHDALTGLFNRYAFNERLEQAFACTESSPAAFLLFDIDNFKQVNDRYGHTAGDEVLRGFSKLPQIFSGDDCMFCRWGGEEFTVFVQGDRDPLVLAEQLRQYVEDTVVRVENAEIRVTVSVGVCLVRNTSDVCIADVIRKADHCLYQSKASGKNRVTSTLLGKI